MPRVIAFYESLYSHGRPKKSSVNGAVQTAEADADAASGDGDDMVEDQEADAGAAGGVNDVTEEEDAGVWEDKGYERVFDPTPGLRRRRRGARKVTDRKRKRCSIGKRTLDVVHTLKAKMKAYYASHGGAARRPKWRTAHKGMNTKTQNRLDRDSRRPCFCLKARLRVSL